MWSAILAFLASLGVPILVDQINKIIDENRTLTQAEANSLVGQILNAAEKKGSAAITKAMTLMNNIPVISGSPALKSYMSKATSNAQDNYRRVEQKVADMKEAAQKEANKVEAMRNDSWSKIATAYIKTGTTEKQRAEDTVKSALNNIENTII